MGLFTLAVVVVVRAVMGLLLRALAETAVEVLVVGLVLAE
jgi:hypothetical protein